MSPTPRIERRSVASRWRRRLGVLSRRTRLQQQLGLVAAAGVLVLAVASALVGSWQAAEQIRASLVEQGERIAQNLASQSTFALLSSASENAAPGIAATLAFPDVRRIEILGADGRLLAARGEPPEGPSGLPAATTRTAAREPYLAGEDDAAWVFAAPVWTRPVDSPFEVMQRADQRLGEVRVVQSKDTLRRITARVFGAHLSVSLACAAVFLLAMRLLGARLTRPLGALGEAMARAERGEADVRAPVGGPRDVASMAHRYNQMITTLTAREDELTRHRGQLEDQVLARTRELLEAKERAEVANRAKSDFLARMSHELRTPLNAVLGYAQVLQMEPVVDERQRHGLATIQRSGEHLLLLITDILDLARIESGKTDLRPAPVGLREMLRGVADIARVRADAKGLEFVVEDDALGAPTVEVDERRLRQVLLNLLGNAVKFTDAGRVVLRAALRPGEAPGRLRVRFEVEDTGVGIDPEDLRRVFLPFEQAGDARRRSEGTGLGLAISRQLARLMGGDVHVDSRAGAGSRFWLDLDLARAEEAPLAPSGMATADVTGYEGRRRRVLVVDDVPGNRSMLRRMLETLGFDVDEAADGHEALAAVRRGAPDLVLMDMVMPGLDGLEATRRLRADASLKGLPVVAVTANASNADRASCLAAGADEFCTKPVDRDVLVGVLARRLQLTWTRRDPAPDPA